MGIRYRKRVMIAPGIHLILSGSGMGLSVGGREASVSFGHRGVHANLGLPGTGLSYRARIGTAGGATSARNADRYRTVGVSVGLADDGTLDFKTNDGSALTDRDLQRAKREYRAVFEEFLGDRCKEFNDETLPLLSIHLQTPNPTARPLYRYREFPGSPPAKPTQPSHLFEPSAPLLEPKGLTGRLFHGIARAIDERNAATQARYEEQLAIWRGAVGRRDHQYHLQLEEYDNALSKYDTARQSWIESESQRKWHYECGSLDSPQSMAIVLEDSLASIVWPRETSVEFDLNESADSVNIWMELPRLDAPDAEQWPSHEAVVNRTSLKLVFKNRPRSLLQRDFAVHVHSSAFRIIGEVFSCLPSVRTIVFSGEARFPSPETGADTTACVLADLVKRTEWERIDFSRLEHIDVLRCFSQFETRLNLTRAFEFRPVEPFPEQGCS